MQDGAANYTSDKSLLCGLENNVSVEANSQRQSAPHVPRLKDALTRPASRNVAVTIFAILDYQQRPVNQVASTERLPQLVRYPASKINHCDRFTTTTQWCECSCIA